MMPFRFILNSITLHNTEHICKYAENFNFVQAMDLCSSLMENMHSWTNQIIYTLASAKIPKYYTPHTHACEHLGLK